MRALSSTFALLLLPLGHLVAGPIVDLAYVGNGGVAYQSSMMDPYAASLVNDGTTATFHHTQLEYHPWVEIRLDGLHYVHEYELFHRPCWGCGDPRNSEFRVELFEGAVVVGSWNYANMGDWTGPVELSFTPVVADRIRLTDLTEIPAREGNTWLHMSEIRLYGDSTGVPEPSFVLPAVAFLALGLFRRR